MNTKTIVACFLVVLVAGQAYSQLTGLVESQLFQAVLRKLGSLWQNGHFELMRRPCNYSVKPRISRLKLKYEGKVWCPGWTGITGKAKTNSRADAVEQAIRTFLNQAAESGLISPDDAREYIESKRVRWKQDSKELAEA